MAVKTKKVILFIVEGPTDEDALSSIIKQIFKSENIHFRVIHGDITSERSTSVSNAIKTVNEQIDIQRKRYGLKKEDIVKVIHLVDTDGAFIPVEKVMYRKGDTIQYFDDRIESSIPENIVERNTRKSQVLGRLHTTSKVGKLPYYIYYFSRNLEHVMHNINTDLTSDEKSNYADDFSDKYISDPDSFISFISSSDFTVQGDYTETWNFIFQGVNSLHRHSNFHLLFKEKEIKMRIK